MNKIVKSTITFIIIGIAGYFSLTGVSAFTISPSSGQHNAGDTFNVQILANNTANDAVSIRLNMTNLTVTSYTDATGMLSLGACTGGTKFTSSTVCVDVVKGSNFTNGEAIATIGLQVVSTGTTTITAASGSEYLDGTPVSGTVATYTVVSGAPASNNTNNNTLPNTATDLDSTIQLLFLGFALVSFGLVLRELLNYYYENRNDFWPD